MTDRINGFMVVLESAMREDDAESLRRALEHMRGVAKVEPVDATPMDSALVESRLRHRLIVSLLNISNRIVKGEWPEPTESER